MKPLFILQGIMAREDNAIKYKPEPLLAINEFEEAAGAILDLTKDQIAKNIEEARTKADEILKKGKDSFSLLEKEELKKTGQEIDMEKEKLFLKAKEGLKFIEDIPEEKIKEAVGYILEKIIPR